MNVFTAVGPCCVGCLASAPNRRRRSFPDSTSSPTDFGAEADSPVRFDSSIPSPDDERRCPSAATWSPVRDGRRYTTPPCPRAPLRWWRSASVSGLGQPGGGCLAGGPIGRVFFRRIMLNGPDSGIDDPDTPKRPSAKDPASNQPVPVDEHTWARCTSVASHKRSFLDIAPRPDTRPGSVADRRGLSMSDPWLALIAWSGRADPESEACLKPPRTTTPAQAPPLMPPCAEQW